MRRDDRPRMKFSQHGDASGGFVSVEHHQFDAGVGPRLPRLIPGLGDVGKHAKIQRELGGIASAMSRAVDSMPVMWSPVHENPEQRAAQQQHAQHKNQADRVSHTGQYAQACLPTPVFTQHRCTMRFSIRERHTFLCGWPFVVAAGRAIHPIDRFWGTRSIAANRL